MDGWKIENVKRIEFDFFGKKPDLIVLIFMKIQPLTGLSNGHCQPEKDLNEKKITNWW